MEYIYAMFSTFHCLPGLIACALWRLLCWRWRHCCWAVPNSLRLGRPLSLAMSGRRFRCLRGRSRWLVLLLPLHLLHVPLLRGRLKLGSGIPHHSSLHHWHCLSGQQRPLFLQRWCGRGWGGGGRRGCCSGTGHGCKAYGCRRGSCEGDHGDRNGHRGLRGNTGWCGRSCTVLRRECRWG